MKKYLIILPAATLIFSIIATFSYAYEIITVNVSIKTQGVNATVCVKTDDSKVFPGKTVSYKPMIDYRGIDAYIRLKLDFNSNVINEEMFAGLDEKWVKKGNYYYYRDVVKHGERISSFNSFTVPDIEEKNSESVLSGSEFRVSLLCDAVQADNFSPDFESENPWGDLSVAKSSYSGEDYAQDENKERVPVEIKFSGAGKYALSASSIISEYIKPGDTCRGEIRLKNEGKESVEVDFFESKSEKQSDIRMSEKIGLKIKVNDKIFYDGALNSEVLKKKKNLCTLNPSEEKIVLYEFYMPEDADNTYDAEESYFIWNFQSEGKDMAADTGDRNKLMFFIALSGTSFVLLILMKKKRDGKDDL